MWQEILLSLVLGIFALYWYLSRNNNYWKERNIPYVPPKPFFGSLNIWSSVVGRVPMHELDTINYKKYGRIYGFFEGSSPALAVADPELLKDIFIKDFHVFSYRRDLFLFDPVLNNVLPMLKGERWRRVRTALTPVFSSGKMRKMAILINQCAEITCKNLEKFAEKESSVDVKKFIEAFTMDAIATTAFGTKIDSYNDPNNPFVKHANALHNQNISLALLFIYAFPSLFRLFGGAKFFSKMTDFFKNITLKLIKERRENPEKRRNDFLQLILDQAQEMKEAGSEAAKEAKPPPGGQDQSSAGLSEIEIVAQCVIFFLAGSGGTTSALSLTIYQLARHPECQEKVAADVRRVLKENDNVADYDTVKKMTYLDAVICETLRIFPPGTKHERKTVEEYHLGSTGLTLPKGMQIIVPLYAIHHDAEYFPDPEKFDPDRFLPENRDAIKPFTYLPFGAGPRNCIAERFALLELKLCLALLINKLKFRVAPETKIPPKFYANQGNLIPYEVFVKVERRE